MTFYVSKPHITVTQALLSQLSYHSPSVHGHVLYSLKNPECLCGSTLLPELLDLIGKSLSSALLSLLQIQVASTSYSLKAWSACGVLLILQPSAYLAHRCHESISIFLPPVFQMCALLKPTRKHCRYEHVLLCLGLPRVVHRHVSRYPRLLKS